MGAVGRMIGGIFDKRAISRAVLNVNTGGVMLAAAGAGRRGVERGLDDGNLGMRARDGIGGQADVDVLAADGATAALDAAQPVARPNLGALVVVLDHLDDEPHLVRARGAFMRQRRRGKGGAGGMRGGERRGRRRGG